MKKACEVLVTFGGQVKKCSFDPAKFSPSKDWVHLQVDGIEGGSWEKTEDLDARTMEIL